MKLRTVSILLAVLAMCAHLPAQAQFVQTSPLEWLALAEGNEVINGQVEEQVEGQTKTAALQNTIAAEFNKIHEWERKYSTLGRLRKAVTENPQGILAVMSMNNLYIETATELVTVYTLLRNAVATGGPQNMLTGSERSETLWALSDRLDAFKKKLQLLHLSIRYYTMTDVWNDVTAGMIDRNPGEVANAALERWQRAARMTR